MKKLLVLLIMLMIAVMLTCAVAEDEPTVYTSGDYKYVLLEDGTAEITGYTGKAKELTIPATLDGYNVTSIGESAFFGCASLTSITLPSSVTSIEDDTFDCCTSLTNITVTRDSYAHQYCIDHGLPYTYPDANDWLLN